LGENYKSLSDAIASKYFFCLPAILSKLNSCKYLFSTILGVLHQETTGLAGADPFLGDLQEAQTKSFIFLALVFFSNAYYHSLPLLGVLHQETKGLASADPVGGTYKSLSDANASEYFFCLPAILSKLNSCKQKKP